MVSVVKKFRRSWSLIFKWYIDMVHNKAGFVNDIDNISGESVEHVNEI